MAKLTRVTDAFVYVKSKLAGAIQRLLEDKMTDTLSIKDFGAVGDGIHDDTDAIEAAFAAAKNKFGVIAPSGRYRVTREIPVDYALVLIGEGGNGFKGTNSSHNPSPHFGTTFVSDMASGYVFNISPAAFQFGLTLRDFSIERNESLGNNSARGMRLHNVGWTGIVDNVCIDGFGEHGLVIGYIQDTHFRGCTVLRCGNEDVPSIEIVNDSNYVYFLNCHIEYSPFLFKNTGNAWEVHFTNTHIEVAQYGSGSGLPTIKYKQAPLQLSGGNMVTFNTCTIVPVSDEYLQTALGIPFDSLPYFITGSGSFVKFINCSGIAPEGSVSYMYLSGTGNKVIGGTWKDMTPRRPSIVLEDGDISNNTLAIRVAADETKLFGVLVNTRGKITNNLLTASSAASATRRTTGILVGCSPSAPLGVVQVSGNTYDLGNRPNRYVYHRIQIVGHDGGCSYFEGINSALFDLDYELYSPAANFAMWNTSSWQVTSQINMNPGREVMFHAGAIAGYINHGTYVKNATFNNLAVEAGASIMYKGISDGEVRMFQVK